MGARGRDCSADEWEARCLLCQLSTWVGKGVLGPWVTTPDVALELTSHPEVGLEKGKWRGGSRSASFPRKLPTLLPLLAAQL